MRWLRYGSLSSKTVATDGQAQTRSVDSDAQPLQAAEDVASGVDDGDTRTLRVAAGPVVLQQAAHEEHMAAVPKGEPGLHARAATVRGLDDHRRERVAAHHRVAHREGRLRRRRAGQELRDEEALRRDLLLQRGILRRVRRSMPVPMTATVRPPAASAAVCAAVSMPAARPLMTGHRSPRAPQRVLRLVDALGRRVPGPDDGDRRRIALISGSAHEEDRRALVDHAEVRRVLRVEDGDHPDPGALPPLEVAAACATSSAGVGSNSAPWAGDSPAAAACTLPYSSNCSVTVDQTTFGVVARQGEPLAPHASSLPA